MKKAQITSRAGAALIDGIILSFGAETIQTVWRLPAFHIGYVSMGATAWIGMALTVAYFASMEASPLGATIGKQVMRIRVTSMGGTRLSVTQSVLRAIGRLIPLGWLLALSENERALHDYFGNSQVIES
jgi:uncharacterized RDD family membrane protein YckC